MKNVVENVCAQFLWMRNLLYIFGQPFFWRDAWQWRRWISLDSAYSGERGSGRRRGPVKWQSCESVKTALGCVETGFVDSVRRWKCLKYGILMQRIYNLRLSMSPNGTRGQKSCAGQTTLFTNSGILGS